MISTTTNNYEKKHFILRMRLRKLVYSLELSKQLYVSICPAYNYLRNQDKKNNSLSLH